MAEGCEAPDLPISDPSLPGCTRLKHGMTPVMQEMFDCQTCNLAAFGGQRTANRYVICKVCVKECHAGHQIPFGWCGTERMVFGFCDCGTAWGGSGFVPPCKFSEAHAKGQ